MATGDAMIGVRLTPQELDILDKHTKGQLSRAQIVRMLIQDFIGKPEKEQRQFLTERLFGE